MLRTTIVLAATAAIAVPAAGHAATPAPLRDCGRDGDLDRVYTSAQLANALKRMPADLEEYTNCGSVIRAARTAGRRAVVTRQTLALKVSCQARRVEVKTITTRRLGLAKPTRCAKGTHTVKVTLGRTVRLLAVRRQLVRVTVGSATFVIRLAPR